MNATAIALSGVVGHADTGMYNRLVIGPGLVVPAPATASLAYSLTAEQRTVNALDAGSNPARSASAPQVFLPIFLRAAPGYVKGSITTIIPPQRTVSVQVNCRTRGIGYR